MYTHVAVNYWSGVRVTTESCSGFGGADESRRERVASVQTRLRLTQCAPTYRIRFSTVSTTIFTMPLHFPFFQSNGCIVEVIVVDRNEKPTRPHVLEVKNYMTLTFCDFCGSMLTGLMRQGLHCLACKCNFHRRCTEAPRNNCLAATPGQSTMSPMPMGSGGAAVGISQPSSIIPGASLELPHSLAENNYLTPTKCKICDKMLKGLIRQGLKCRDCGVNVHNKCAHQLPSNCTLSDHAISRMSITDASQANLVSMDDEPSSSENIPLFRLPGQAISKNQAHPKVEGWMIHFLLSNPERRLKHYWVLANDAINMYNEYNEGINPKKRYVTLPLAEILAITPHHGPPVHSKYPPHCFEIRTISNVVYCVGENLHAYSGGPPKKIPRSLSIRPPSNTQLWFQTLKDALQPPVSRNDPPNAERALEFAELYQVLSEKVLGSGQFGTVYSAIQRHTGVEVAVKVISKERFSKKGNGVESMRAEVAILQRVCHSGIVRLEFMCETKDKIFVVMEKMNGDMLELILSQAAGRLDERATRFLLVQILSALKYLHNQGIAHCDLKPENVLLSEMNTNFPQTKICDFGYARFIGESQFRKTIVGTPAYLPPEVLLRQGYNKSLDMWSVGVIIYVTLSGTFPFNEGDEIADQIQNAAFMFPAEPWAEVSPAAINLIQQLLRVKIDERLTIDQCLAHEWLKGEQLYHDLRTLELRLKCQRYLTNPADDEKYTEYLQQRLVPEL
uniref:Protein kinase C n=1 Tax=Angiostrongylus cantonensis TaxID=6313 RepID=A0A158P8F5_ANGCA